MKDRHDTDFSDFEDPSNASVDRLVRSLDRVYHRPWLLIWRSLLSGFMAAIGAVVGTALIGALSVYLFHTLGGAAILNSAVQNLKDTVVPQSIHNR